MDKSRILVMYVGPYDMTSEKTGERVKGCGVRYYFFGAKGETLMCNVSAGGDSMGYQCGKASIDYEKKDKFDFVPGIYDAEFEMKIGSDGKPVLRLKDVDFISSVNFEVMGEDVQRRIAEKAKEKEAKK